ncbi:hypothetical protein CICLE_v100015432mg, partial [Citrus x clementina]
LIEKSTTMKFRLSTEPLVEVCVMCIKAIKFGFYCQPHSTQLYFF